MRSFVIIAILGLFVSCNEESLVEGYNTKNENGGNIIGKWEWVNQSKFTNEVEDYSVDIVSNCPTEKSYKEFKLDGTGAYHDHYESCEDKQSAFKWSRSENVITYGLSGSKEEIVLLDKTTLIVKWFKSSAEYYIDTYKKK